MRVSRWMRRGAALALAATLALRASTASTQSGEDLAAARKLFVEAVADEDAKRYETALDKFRRVAAVKETANVRYRIATCLEALGHLAGALADYEAAVRLARDDKQAADTARAAGERAAALERIVPKITIVVPATVPEGAVVTIDDTPVVPGELRDPIPLDPGHHTIAATAPGAAPFHTGVTLPEGGRLTITIQLEAPAPPAPTPTPTPTPTPAPTPTPTPIPTSTPPPTSTPTAAYVAFGVGGALAIGAVVSAALRTSNLGVLERDCALEQDGNWHCPLESDKSARDSAALEGPLAIGLGAGAAVAVAAGVWMVVGSRDDRPRQGMMLMPVLSRESGMLVLSGPLVR